MGKLLDSVIAWDRQQKEKILAEYASRTRKEGERDAFEDGLLKSSLDELGRGEQEDIERRAKEWESYVENLAKAGAAYRERIAEQAEARVAAAAATIEKEKVLPTPTHAVGSSSRNPSRSCVRVGRRRPRTTVQKLARRAARG